MLFLTLRSGWTCVSIVSFAPRTVQHFITRRVSETRRVMKCNTKRGEKETREMERDTDGTRHGRAKE